MPEISVIVPVYKVEKYLDKCVESIINQTYKDFELILVDDGSPDNCPKICDDFAKKDKRIMVIHQENQGVSVARNNGVLCAKGKYATFVDSDDWVDEKFLEILYNNLIENNAEASVCGAVFVENGIIPETDNENNVRLFNNREAIEYFGNLNNYKFRSPWVKLTDIEILKKHPFPVNRKYGEDMATVYKWYFSAEKTVDCDKALYYYFYNSEGATKNKKFYLNSLHGLLTVKELLSFYEENGFDELFKINVPKYAFELYYRYDMVLKNNQSQEIADKIFAELKSFVKDQRKKGNLSPESAPDAFNLLYPKKMKIYWTVKAQINKFKKDN